MNTPDPAPASGAPRLARRLGAWDATLLTIGSVIGTGIFITTGDMAKVLPSAGWILAVWVVGGLLVLAGALSLAELGAAFPRAGGIYTFLREAYGPLWGFLYGWASFLVIMAGGIAALSIGFGEYLGSFLPWFATSHEIWSLQLTPGWTWAVNGGQLAGVLAILVLTAINAVGVRQGAWVQNLLTAAKVGVIALFVIGGLVVPFARAPGAAASADDGTAISTEDFESGQSGSLELHAGGTASTPPSALPSGPASGPSSLWIAFGVAMIAALWTYDGWYGAVFAAGEMRRPERDLPRGLILGTVVVIVLYLVINLVYARALSISEMAATSRIGETAAAVLFGPTASRWVAGAVVLSTFGCLSATILYSSRIYQPMADDGVFFRAAARIHPRTQVPTVSLWAQSSWAMILALSGSYAQLYTYVTFAVVLFQVMAGVAVVVLRHRQPNLARPYRVWGYPWVPGLFVVGSLLLLGNTLVSAPVESLIGLGLVALGLPAYAWWRRQERQVAA